MVLGHLDETEAYRSNIGFSEISGHPVTLEVRVFDGTTGDPLAGARRYAVKPYSNLQVQLPAGHGQPNLYAVVAGVDGTEHAVAYASRVDNASQDAVYLAARHPEEAAQLMVPAVARTLGSQGTHWRTELRIANLGATTARLELQYRHRRGVQGPPLTASLEVLQGRVFATDDLLLDVFGISEGTGSLRIVAAGDPDPLLVTSRTYSMSERGTYGQFVGAVSQNNRGPATVILPTRRGSTRTNLGLCEVAGRELRVRCEVVDVVGRPTGVNRVVTLAPFQMTQFNDFLDSAEVSDFEALRIDVTVESGEGALAAYASVAEATTGDAIYIPAQPLQP